MKFAVVIGIAAAALLGGTALAPAQAQTIETERSINSITNPRWYCDTYFWGWVPECGHSKGQNPPAPTVSMTNEQVEVDCPEPEYTPRQRYSFSIPYPRCETCYRTRTTFFVNGVRTGDRWSPKQTGITRVSNHSYNKGGSMMKTASNNNGGASKGSGGGSKK